ncbi:MAG: SIR2 family protein [Methylocystaceae bacterium]|nr:SIR2 family protein [Methylocystaceae bacterium]
MVATQQDEILAQVGKHLDRPDLAWLLGAGISYDANIPLMNLLTSRVGDLIQQDDDKSYFDMYNSIRKGLPNEAHIEHILSQLGDIISLTERAKEHKLTLNDVELEQERLKLLYKKIVDHIRTTIRYGYTKNGKDEEIGKFENPIIRIHQHLSFVRAIYQVSRAGVQNRRSSVKFFTTNYDTLLEDALSFERIACSDGFSGGAIGFWNPANFGTNRSGDEAIVIKLHGSIDWRFDEDRNLIKCRDGIHEKDTFSDVLIYPQQTKYVETQKDPFSFLFKSFRSYLSSSKDQALAICGYSFGDEHINLEIEASMSLAGNNTTLLCFVQEPVDPTTKQPNLPQIITKWLRTSNFKERIFVLTDQGLYWGNIENRFPPDEGSQHNWWTFVGVTDLLENGF